MIIDLSDKATPSNTFTISVTEHQRASLIEFCVLSSRLRKKLETAGSGKQLVTVTRRELDELNDGIGRSAHDAPTADRKRLQAVQAKVGELFAGDLRVTLARR